MTDLHVTALGAGPRVLFVHGSVSNGLATFARQEPLADAFRLEIVDRRGFGESPSRAGGVDFDRDADDVLELIARPTDVEGLGEGAHLVGHSYGAVVCLVAAGRDPSLVRSLTVIEPPAFGLARGDAAADRAAERMRKVAPAPEGSEPAAWYVAFLRGLGFDVPNDIAITDDDARDIRASMSERSPEDARPDLEAIRDAGVPALVVRGDWSRASGDARAVGGAAFEAICRVVSERTGARLLVVPGAAHNPQLTRSEHFNAELRAFLEEVEAGRAEGPGSRIGPAAASTKGDTVPVVRQTPKKASNARE